MLSIARSGSLLGGNIRKFAVVPHLMGGADLTRHGHFSTTAVKDESKTEFIRHKNRSSHVDSNNSDNKDFRKFAEQIQKSSTIDAKNIRNIFRVMQNSKRGSDCATLSELESYVANKLQNMVADNNNNNNPVSVPSLQDASECFKYFRAAELGSSGSPRAQLFDAVTAVFTAAPSDVPLSADMFKSALSGFSSMGVGGTETSRAIKAIASRLQHSSFSFSSSSAGAAAAPFTAEDMTVHLYALSFLKRGGSNEVKSFVNILLPRIQSCSEPLTASQLAQCFSVFSPLTSWSSSSSSSGSASTGTPTEAIAMLSALTPKLKTIKTKLNTDNLQSIFRSLHHFSLSGKATSAPDSSSKVVKDFLSVLTQQIARVSDSNSNSNTSKTHNNSNGKTSSSSGMSFGTNSGPFATTVSTTTTTTPPPQQQSFRSFNASYVLSGLRNMSSDVKEVRELLKVVTPLVASSHLAVPFTALRYLSNMKSNSKEVKDFLSVLHRKRFMLKTDKDRLLVGKALYGLKNLNSNALEVRVLVRSVANFIESLDGYWTLNAQGVGNALFGLQSMSSSSEEVLQLLSVLIPKISDCSEPLSEQAASNALYALKNMSSSDTDEVRKLLSVLTEKVVGCPDTWGPQAIGSALFGLNSMDASNVEVKHLLSVLAERVEVCHDVFSPQTVANALYGLRNMQGYTREVRDLYALLTIKLLRSGAETGQYMSSQEISMALYGLKSCNADSREVRELLTALTEQLRRCTGQLNARSVSNALFGLRFMSSNVFEVKVLLEVLEEKIIHSTGLMSSQAVGNALYGLNNMSSDVDGVCDVLTALTPKVAACTEVMNAQEVGNAMYGLRHMSTDSPELVKLVGVLAEKVGACTEEMLPQNVSNSILGLSFMDSSLPEVRSLIRALTGVILRSRDIQPLSEIEVYAILRGMANLDPSIEEVYELLVALGRKVMHCRDHLPAEDLEHIRASVSALPEASSSSSAMLIELLRMPQEPIVLIHEEEK